MLTKILTKGLEMNIETGGDHKEWCKKFAPIMDIVSRETNAAKVIKSIRRKRWWAEFLERRGIRLAWLDRSLMKEYGKLSDVFRQLLLHLNGLDDESLKEVDELMSDRCVEGLRKQGKSFWGFYYPSAIAESAVPESMTMQSGQVVVTEYKKNKSNKVDNGS